MSRQERGAQADSGQIVAIALTSSASIGLLALVVRHLADRESPFGMMLTVRGVALDRHRNLWPEVRRLPGGRARFGTWCRGVAYIFGGPLCESEAQIHLDRAGRLWGTQVHISQNRDEAAAWLQAALAQ